MYLNKTMLMGRLGNDVELRATGSGTSVANFDLATPKAYEDKQGNKQQKTQWHKIVVWGKLGELCSQYLSKGSQACVEGRIQTRSWEDKNGETRYTTEIVSDNVVFLGNNIGDKKEPFNQEDISL